MPIPANQILNAEILVRATTTAAGGGTKNVLNIFQYRRTTNVNPVVKANLSAAFQAAVMVPVLAAMNARYNQVSNNIRWIDDAQDAPASVAAANVGAIATDSTATQSAVFFLFRTALRGKNYRGSKHFTPLSEADTTGDVLTGAGLARWQAVQAALVLALVDANGNTWVPTVVSRSLSQLVLNPTTVITNDVTTCSLNKTVGTMRRRKTVSVY